MTQPATPSEPHIKARPIVFHSAQFGRYFLIDQISKGGMSDIFLAKTHSAGGFRKALVIKRLLPQYTGKARYVKRFINEAQTLSLLNHSNIVQIMDMGVIGTEYYIALEYIEGRNVAHLISKSARTGKRPPLELIMHIVLETARGLAYAHRKKGVNGESLMLVHQDVNSFNVMVSFEGEVKIIDFGIARIFLDPSSRDGLPVAGKLLYFSPEQLQKKPLDRRVDMYGIGALFYELITGERLVQHQETPALTIKAILDVDIADRVNNHDRIPDELRPILIKTMAMDPADRYPWMEDLIVDVQKVVRSQNLEFSPAVFSAFLKDLFAKEMLLDRKRMRKLMSEERRKGDLPGNKAALPDIRTDLLEEIQTLCAALPGLTATLGSETVCREVFLHAGALVFEQGDGGEEMFVVQEGRLRSYVKVGNVLQAIAVLEPGDFFGESSLVNQPRNVTVRAETDCRLIRLRARAFLQLSGGDSNGAVVRSLADKLRASMLLLECALSQDDLSKLICALLFFQQKDGPHEGKDYDLNEILEFFRLKDIPDLKKYLDKLKELRAVEYDDRVIRITNSDKLMNINNILAGRGRKALKLR